MSREDIDTIIKVICPNDEDFENACISPAFLKRELEVLALEQYPCGDAISRELALEKMADYVASGYADSAEDFEEYSKIICQLPPVRPDQKMGRWIMSEDGLYRPICNKCGAHPWKGYIPTTKEATEVFKYCPNCGAKMQEVEE